MRKKVLFCFALLLPFCWIGYAGWLDMIGDPRANGFAQPERIYYWESVFVAAAAAAYAMMCMVSALHAVRRRRFLLALGSFFFLWPLAAFYLGKVVFFEHADAPTNLFVYGTLAPGQANHQLLSHCVGTWQKATLQGYILDEDLGFKIGYPCIVPSVDGDAVEGYLLTSKALSEQWTMLDKFEGEAYERIQVRIRLANNEEVEGYAYAIANSA